jgi:hypothetical protein
MFTKIVAHVHFLQVRTRFDFHLKLAYLNLAVLIFELAKNLFEEVVKM